MFLSNFSIGRRLALVLGAILALFLATSLFAVLKLRAARRRDRGHGERQRQDRARRLGLAAPHDLGRAARRRDRQEQRSEPDRLLRAGHRDLDQGHQRAAEIHRRPDDRARGTGAVPEGRRAAPRLPRRPRGSEQAQARGRPRRRRARLQLALRTDLGQLPGRRPADGRPAARRPRRRRAAGPGHARADHHAADGLLRGDAGARQPAGLGPVAQHHAARCAAPRPPPRRSARWT